MSNGGDENDWGKVLKLWKIIPEKPNVKNLIKIWNKTKIMWKLMKFCLN